MLPITIGVDLGQAVDHTACTVIETMRPPLQADGSRPERRHRLRLISQIPLGVNYVTQVDQIAKIVESARALGEVTLVVDCTGVGKGVWDMLGRRMPTVTRKAVVFTSGQNETQPEYNVHRVPKIDLLTAILVTLEGKRLKAHPAVRWCRSSSPS
jgi:hypothetical protein